MSVRSPVTDFALRIVLGASLSVISSIIASGQPAMALRDTLISMGPLYHGTKHTRTLTIRNVGSENLHISSVRSSCGCTTTQMGNDDIRPGDSAEISFTVNTSILSGKVHKNIDIASNEPARPVRRIWYEADVVNVLSSVPSYLFFGEGQIGAELTRDLRLTNSTKQPIRIVTLSSASGKLKFSHLPDLLAPGDSTKLTVTLTAEVAGTFKDELRIETDNSMQRTVRIGVAAVVRAQK